jgi:hypothetical protein
MECEHVDEDISDFTTWSSAEGQYVRHYYCHTCKAHWFRGTYYTREEWEVKYG